ncbi:hypothetical protein BGX38DRAFT_1198373 [Terfezia claveryi]|nr:hypothetical protein BGX38DRAFT_1198373 [Terfezia claveryi]
MKPSIAAGICTFRPLNALKSIIHPPLPLTAGQSQRLLGLLKTSFREQLAAADAASVPHNGGATEPHRSPVDVHLSSLLKAPVFTSGSGALMGTSGRVEQVRVEHFIRNPLVVYHKLASHGIPTPDIAWAVLKRHTSNMLALPKQELKAGWAVKTVLEVIKPLRNISPRVHLEDKRLREQIIKTLVAGGEEEIAAGMLNKPWLLHISAEQSDAKELLELRESIIKEVTKSVEQFKGMNAAASQFLWMVKNWQCNVEKFPGIFDTIGGLSTNPFKTTGQYFLLRYAHKQDPQIFQLRMNIYNTCVPWIKSNFAKARLMLHYENNPHRLYEMVMFKSYLEQRVGFTTVCFELILSLVHHGELAKACKVASLMRTRLIGNVLGLEPAMVDEVEKLLNSPNDDVLARLADMISKSTGKFTDGVSDIFPNLLESRQQVTFA